MSRRGQRKTLLIILAIESRLLFVLLLPRLTSYLLTRKVRWMCAKCVSEKQSNRKNQSEIQERKGRTKERESANESQLLLFTHNSEFSAHHCLKQLTLLETSFHTWPNLVTLKVIGKEFKRLKEISHVCNCKRGAHVISIVTQISFGDVSSHNIF